jgi:hypothetical protein
MLNVLRQIHPHARLWIVSAITLGILLIINTPVEKTVDTPVEKTVKIYKQPQGRVVAYYNNDYQRYAVDKLIQLDMLEHYPCLFELWTKESNWRPKARNKSSGALGIAQLMPETWVNIKTEPTLNGYKQVDAGLAYIERKYGKKGICRAYAHHLAKNWY